LSLSSPKTKRKRNNTVLIPAATARRLVRRVSPVEKKPTVFFSLENFFSRLLTTTCGNFLEPFLFFDEVAPTVVGDAADRWPASMGRRHDTRRELAAAAADAAARALKWLLPNLGTVGGSASRRGGQN